MIIIFLILIIFIFALYENSNPDLRKRNLMYAFLGIIWCLLPAIRDELVGTDTSNYIEFFRYPQLGYNGREEVEIGFEIWNHIVRLLSSNKYVYLFLSALLSTIPLLLMIYKMSTRPIMALYIVSTIVLLEPFLFVEYGTMRQSLSIGFFLVFFFYLVYKNNFRLSILYGLLSYSFHNSTLLPIILVLLIHFSKYQPSKKFAYLLIALSFVFGNVSVFYLQDFFLTVSTIVQIGQVGYLEHIELDELVDGYGYFRNVLPICLYAIFCIYNSCEKDEHKKLLQTSIITVVFTNILITIPIGQRITYALIPILCINVANKINSKNIKYILPVLLFEFYRLFSYYQAQDSGVQGEMDGNIIFPYNTFFE